MSSVWTIRRSASDAKLAGLGAGIARHWGVDPVLIRVSIAVLAFSGGIGLVLYAAGWLLIPVEGKDEAPVHDLLGGQSRRWPREAWIAIVAVCCIVSVTVLGTDSFGFGPAVVLALIWYFGYYRNRSTRVDGVGGGVPPDPRQAAVVAQAPQFYSYSGPPTPFTEAATAWRQRIEEAQHSQVVMPLSTTLPLDAAESADSEPVGPAWSLPPAQPLGVESADYHAFLAQPDPVGLYAEPAPPASAHPAPAAAATLRPSASRAAKRVRLAAFLAVGLAVAGLAVADGLGASIPAAAYVAATLLVLGLALVAATWFGRARGLLPVAVLVLLGTIGSTVAGPVASNQGWGSVQRSYASVPELTRGDRQQLGRLQVDLTRLTPSANATYTAHLDFGSLEVAAPRTANVVVNWQAKAGTLILNGEDIEGSTTSGVVRLDPVDPKQKTLTLNLSVNGGVVQVTR